MENLNKRKSTNMDESRRVTILRRRGERKRVVPEAKNADSNRKLTSSTSHSRIITSFSGGIIPEYKGYMPRIGHTAFMYNKNFYIFGGLNAKGHFVNHFCFHEKRSFLWKEMRGVGNVPTGRANHSLVFCEPHKIMIYGGHRNLEVFDTLYTFNLLTSQWDKINYDKSNSPGPLFLHAAVYVPATNSMFVIGGFHQRAYNMYLGHVFDIRNRVWCGFPGPKGVDSQQLQFVTATYHEPSASIVILGLRERDTEGQDGMATPFVYLLNVNTLIWTRVQTSRSSESPVLFRMDVVWSTFLCEFVMMGGFYDEGQQSWYFPLNLSELTVLNEAESPGGAASPQSKSLLDVNSMSPSTVSLQTKKGSSYGFFKLQLNDFTWSVVESKFPRSILKGLVAKTRERINEQIMQSSFDEYSNMFSPTHAGRPRYRSMKRSSDSLSPKGENLSLKELALISSNTLMATPKPVSKALLYTVKGAPIFYRKYAYAAYYHTPSNSDKKRVRQFHYLIMHGGLRPGEDYAMLMFTPENGRTGSPAKHERVDSCVEVSIIRDNESDSSSFLNAVHNNSEGTFKRVYGETPLPLDDESINLSFSYPDNAQLDVKDALPVKLPMISGANDALLKTLPASGNKENTSPFALLYHENNSVTHFPHLLLYPNCPVAVLRSKADVNDWATCFYSDSRTWLAERLKEAIMRDRKERKNLRLQKQHQKNQKRDHAIARGRGDAGLHLSNTESDSDSSEDSSSSEYNMEFGDPIPGGLSGSQGHSKRRDTNSSGKIFANMPSPQNLKDEEEELFQRDFFTRNDLDLFSLMPRHFSNVLGINLPKDSEVDTEEEIMNLFNNIGPGRLHMNVKRRAEIQRLPSAIFRTPLSSKNEVVHHVGDLGSATAYVLMSNALKLLEGDYSPEACAARARLRWRFLRAMVRTGEAAFILYRVNRVETKKRAFRVTSSLGLLLAPELHLVGPTRTHKVPSRPVPYVLPRQRQHLHLSAEVTPSGMMVYKNLRRNAM
ncbi:unnamed protein product [Phytomonas sp. EM1]|nr:unnamed protein product [Phytomonas sp. EM1]|eukprot:CCW60016.1 unnamed protein product [Phytomonas sp. isolate EM1]